MIKTKATGGLRKRIRLFSFVGTHSGRLHTIIFQRFVSDIRIDKAEKNTQTECTMYIQALKMRSLSEFLLNTLNKVHKKAGIFVLYQFICKMASIKQQDGTFRQE